MELLVYNIYIYIYIYIERERYIYIYIYREREIIEVTHVMFARPPGAPSK